MRSHHVRLTSRVVVVALGLSASAVGCSDISSPTRATPVAASVADTNSTITQHSASAAEEGFPVSPELAAVRRATARLHDINEAYAAGYTTENEPCVSSPAGAMGVHAPNLALILDPALDPLRPELLLYLAGPNGKYRLIGVEYFQAVLLRNLETGEVAPRLDPTPWDPAKYEVVNPQPQLFGHAFHLSPPPVPHVPWHWALHVWIWSHNPAGMFADWNPALSCN